MTAAHGPPASAALAQLGERQTEDLKVPGSIPGRGNFLLCPTVNIILPNIRGDDVADITDAYKDGLIRSILDVKFLRSFSTLTCRII